MQGFWIHDSVEYGCCMWNICKCCHDSVLDKQNVLDRYETQKWRYVHVSYMFLDSC
jgi:hypothetical protein